MVELLEELGVELTISVPFERFVERKGMIEKRRKWKRWNATQAFIELPWKPKAWSQRYRFIVVRRQVEVRDKGPVQLDLFIPHAVDSEFKVLVTNRSIRAREVVAFHEGRGAQEAVFAELKSQGQLDYVPTKTLAGNQMYLLCAILAYNLNRELQMATQPQDRTTTTQRAPLWKFERLETMRRKLLQRAGRFTQPQRRLTLTLAANANVREELLQYRDELLRAA